MTRACPFLPLPETSLHHIPWSVKTTGAEHSPSYYQHTEFLTQAALGCRQSQSTQRPSDASLYGLSIFTFTCLHCPQSSPPPLPSVPRSRLRTSQFPQLLDASQALANSPTKDWMNPHLLCFFDTKVCNITLQSPQGCECSFRDEFRQPALLPAA
jgi:hypothetical protein